MSPFGPCVTQANLSRFALSANAKLMKVWRVSWTCRPRRPSSLSSSRNCPWTTGRAGALRAGRELRGRQPWALAPAYDPIPPSATLQGHGRVRGGPAPREGAPFTRPSPVAACGGGPWTPGGVPGAGPGCPKRSTAKLPSLRCAFRSGRGTPQSTRAAWAGPVAYFVGIRPDSGSCSWDSQMAGDRREEGRTRRRVQPAEKTGASPGTL